MTTVLLSDPDPNAARRHAETLQRAGFCVEVVSAGLERRDLAPDVVVLSVPRLEPSLLRVVSKGRAVPRIVISSDASDRIRAAEFDCAAVLIRPVPYDDLVNAVRYVVRMAAKVASV